MSAALLARRCPPRRRARDAPAGRDVGSLARDLVERLEARHARDRATWWPASRSPTARACSGASWWSGGSSRSSGPGRMRWEYKEPEQKLFVSDGKTFYFYVPADRQVIVQRAGRAAVARGAAALRAGRAPRRVRGHASTSPSRRASSASASCPASESADLERASIDVEPSGRIRSILLEDLQGNRTRFRFEDVRENTGLSRRALPLRDPGRGRGDPRMRRAVLLAALLARRSAAPRPRPSAPARRRSGSRTTTGRCSSTRGRVKAATRQRRSTAGRSSAPACAPPTEHANMARRLAGRGLYKEALDEYRLALDLNPGRPGVAEEIAGPRGPARGRQGRGLARGRQGPGPRAGPARARPRPRGPASRSASSSGARACARPTWPWAGRPGVNVVFDPSFQDQTGHPRPRGRALRAGPERARRGRAHLPPRGRRRGS